MRSQQLYINGVAVDMPTDEIKIKVESNIFNDADKVKTAHSYNIVLPRTLTNDNIFAMAYVPSANTGGKSTHRYLNASLYIDEIALFGDGYAVLTSVDDKGYNLTLLWGLLNIFDIVKDEGLDLCDIVMSQLNASGDVGLWGQWSSFSMDYYVSGMTNAIYNTLDDDSKRLAQSLPWHLPVVSANDILGTINTIYSLPLSISASAQGRIDELFHPLTSLNCLAKDEVCVVNLRTAWVQNGGNWYCEIMPYGWTTGSSTPVDYYPLTSLQYDTPPSAFHSATNKWQANNAIMPNDGNQILANSKLDIQKVRVFGTNAAAFSVEVNGETASSSLVGGVHTIDHTFTDEFSVDKGGVAIVFTCNTASSSQLASGINIQLHIKGIDLSNGCYSQNGDWWSYVRNYPKMSVVAYLNELMAHIGGCIVGSITDTSSLRLMTIDEIVGGSPTNMDMYGLSNITMSLDDLAQKNNYTHKENDDNGVKYLADGVIYTADSTLEISRNAFESKFRVPMNTMVRLWDVEKIDNDTKYKAKWVGGSDYICGWDSNALVFRNTGQDFERTISAYYSAFEGLVERPKAVEAVVRFGIFDLLSFDMGRPVYINQLGRRYLVKSLENENGETYKIKLVQI